ncbi:MAG: hypothetical protein ACOX8X_05005 [Methanomethylophilus sp.]|jgi:hypothetical protein
MARTTAMTRHRMKWGAVIGGAVGLAIGWVGYLMFDSLLYLLMIVFGAVIGAYTVKLWDGNPDD